MDSKRRDRVAFLGCGHRRAVATSSGNGVQRCAAGFSEAQRDLPALSVFALRGTCHGHRDWIGLGQPLPLARGCFAARIRAARSAQPEREQLLRALLPPNVEVVRVSPRVRIRAEKFLLLPFLAGDCAGYLPAEYVQFFRARAFTAFDSLPSEPPKRRLLISRRLAAKRQFANQSDLDERLGTLGFESVELESLSLADQIELFSQAEVVVAAHGAGLTNLLFATDCKVLEVFLNDRPLAHYRWLARALGHEYANILGANTEKNANAAAPIEAIVARLAELGIQ